MHDQSGSGATLFIEPLAVVELNNRWREAQLAEEEEIHRILAALTGLVAAAARPITRTVEALGDLDLIFAKARYANETARQSSRSWCPGKKFEAAEGQGRASRGTARPTSRGAEQPTDDQLPVSSDQHPGSTLAFIQARHPLLDPLTVVPVDIYLDDDYFVLLITGPNTGGKTVSLKTIGLLTLMAQAGLAIPADEGSKLSVFEQVLRRHRRRAEHRAEPLHLLVAHDAHRRDPGAGRRPLAGAAGRAGRRHRSRRRRGAGAGAAQHAARAAHHHPGDDALLGAEGLRPQHTPFVANASVEFDIETLSPTYKLSIGLPGRSNAFAIARRLGLPTEIVARAEALVSPQSMEAEAMLAEIKRAREAALTAESETKAAQHRAEALNADLQLPPGEDRGGAPRGA